MYSSNRHDLHSTEQASRSFRPEDLRHCSVIVANRTGGQGKTLVSQLVSLCFEEFGFPKKLAAADSTAPDEQSKLGKLHRGHVMELGLGADIDAIRNDPTKAVAHWDAMGSLLCDGDVVIDLGANLVDRVWDWAKARRASDVLRDRHAPPIVLIVPVRAQAQAIEDAFAVLERSIREDAHLPIAARILVLNEASGSFAQYGNHGDFERLNAMKHNAGLKVMLLPQCRSEIWSTLERNHIPLSAVMSLTTDEVAQDFRLDAFAASGARADFLTWLETVVDQFQRIGLIPADAAEEDGL